MVMQLGGYPKPPKYKHVINKLKIKSEYGWIDRIIMFSILIVLIIK